MTITGLDHVQVSAPRGCEDAAREFYGELLGLEELEKPTLLAVRGGAWFRAGQQAVHVGVAEAFAPATKAHPALKVSSVEELERLADRLREAACEIAWAAADEIPGTTRFFVNDPWGNRIELIA